MNLEAIKEYALSNDDIQQILNPDTKLWTYPELAGVSTIEELFDGLGRCIILYLTEDQHTGHWVCMMKRGNKVEYFDPYGKKPDNPLTWLSREAKAELDESQSYLYPLFRRGKVQVISSSYPYQKNVADVNTCGRHCITRLVLKDYSLEQYYDLIQKSGLDPDTFVSLFTYDILGK